jgi:hypothetical protein
MLICVNRRVGKGADLYNCPGDEGLVEELGS